jgi:hypothetical protein
MSFAKYKLAAFFSYHTAQPLPQNPLGEDSSDKPNFLLGGAEGQWLKQQMRNKDSRMCILSSLKQSKKGMPRPSSEALKVAEEKLKIDLSTRLENPQEGIVMPWEEAEEFEECPNVEINLSRRTITEQLQRAVREVFQDKRYTMEDRLKSFFPSTSANYIKSRNNLGAVGNILEDPDLLTGLRTPGGHIKFIDPITRGIPEDECISIDAPNVSTGDLHSNFSALYWRMLKKAKEEIQFVEPVGLAESLKVRVITKGQPNTQTVLKNLQRFLHKTLRKHPTFVLLGETVSEENILNGLKSKLEEGYGYMSGDYKSATDGIASWASEAVADEISRVIGLSEVERVLFRNNLTGNVFVVRDDKEGYKGLLQQRGQLMGSITSFPVLCIINAAMCRWSYELSEKKRFLFRDTPLLINGDDCAMRCNAKAYRYWKRITSAVGLSESIGKTYYSPNFVEINSRIFERVEKAVDVVTERDDGSKVTRQTNLKEVKLVNLGLLRGLKRSSKASLNDQSSVYENIGARARLLIRECPNSLQVSVMKIFIKEHKKVLDQARVPWYIPDWLGGIGIPSGSWGEPSELDKRLATKILLNWKKEHPISLARQEAPWKTWQLATKGLPEPIFCREKGPHTDRYNDAVAKKCLDLLFDENISIDDLYQVVSSEKNLGRKLLKKNQKFWKPAGKLPQPIDPEDLKFIPLHPNWEISEPRKSTGALDFTSSLLSHFGGLGLD